MVLGVLRQLGADDGDRARTEVLGAFIGHAALTVANARLYADVEDALAHQVDLNRQKDDFVAVVSHELRTPLASMLGSVSTLRSMAERLGPDQRARLVDMALRQGKRLQYLIEDLLLLATVEQAEIVMPADEAVDLRTMVEEIGDELAAQRPGEPAPDIRFEDVGAGQVCSDERKLRRLISNLVDNAAKYAPGGVIRRPGRTERRHPHPRRDRRRARHRRRRSGPHLRAFRAARPDLHPHRRGHGPRPLPLPPARRRARGYPHPVRRRRWRVPLHADTDLPPVGRADQRAGRPRRRARTGPGRRHHVGGRERAMTKSHVNHVLVVDDDPDIRMLLTMNLEMSGYLVTEAENGHQAGELARSLVPDLIVLDLMMPGVDGLGVLEGLKANPVTKDIPVVMLTAKAGDHDVWAGWQAGVDYYMTKPFDPEHLLQFIEYLGDSEHRQVPGQTQAFPPGLGDDESDSAPR